MTEGKKSESSKYTLAERLGRGIVKGITRGVKGIAKASYKYTPVAYIINIGANHVARGAGNGISGLSGLVIKAADLFVGKERNYIGNVARMGLLVYSAADAIFGIGTPRNVSEGIGMCFETALDCLAGYAFYVDIKASAGEKVEGEKSEGKGAKKAGFFSALKKNFEGTANFFKREEKNDKGKLEKVADDPKIDSEETSRTSVNEEAVSENRETYNEDAKYPWTGW